MTVLVYLAERAGQAVTHDELLTAFWRGAFSSRNAVHKCVTELRQAFANGNGETTHIETIAKRGYRLIAPVSTQPVFASIPADKTIAVLRFRNVNEDSEQEHLADRIAAALLNALQAVPGISVTDRERSFLHAIGNESVQDIGGALGVDHLLLGTVSTVGHRLHILVELYRSSDSEPVYAYRDAAPVTKILQIEDKVIANVLTALEIYLDPARAADIRNWGTRNIDAYLAALEGDAFVQRLDQKSIAYAAARFRAAIALDPGFMTAYSSLAGVLETLHLYTPAEDQRQLMRDEVKQLHDAARDRGGDPRVLGEISRAQVTMSTKAWSDVEAVTRAAIVAEGVSHRIFDSYIKYVDLLKSGHLFREAGRYLDLCERLEKDNPWVHLRRAALVAMTLGPRRAIPQAKRVLTMFQNDVGTLTALVAHLALLGDYDEAESYLERLEENDQTGMWAHVARLQLGALRGDYAAGSKQLRAVLDDPRTNNYMAGITHFILGDVEAGVAAWRRGREATGPTDIVFMFAVHNETYYPRAVIDDPRYQDSLESGGIGRRWTAYLRERVAELAPITGIEPGDPSPQTVVVSR